MYLPTMQKRCVVKFDFYEKKNKIFIMLYCNGNRDFNEQEHYIIFITFNSQ